MGLRIDPIRVTVDLTEGDEIRPGIVRTSAGGIHCADCCVGGMHALEFVFATPSRSTRWAAGCAMWRPTSVPWRRRARKRPSCARRLRPSARG